MAGDINAKVSGSILEVAVNSIGHYIFTAHKLMITCPNCAHVNPDGTTQCEACYTPLPETAVCPNCNATVSASAEYCGQCGYALQEVNLPPAGVAPTVVKSPVPAVMPSELGNIVPPPAPVPPPSSTPETAMPQISPPVSIAKTQLQHQTARLLHVQTNTTLELPTMLDLIHLGKPNDRIPPDIDVSGFPDSDIVSRIHADIRVEGDAYYIEDVGSSNGTYVNNLPLRPGDRYRLRAGDRIALGKGDKVSFLFQM